MFFYDRSSFSKQKQALFVVLCSNRQPDWLELSTCQRPLLVTYCDHLWLHRLTLSSGQIRPPNWLALSSLWLVNFVPLSEVTRNLIGLLAMARTLVPMLILVMFWSQLVLRRQREGQAPQPYSSTIIRLLPARMKEMECG